MRFSLCFVFCFAVAASPVFGETPAELVAHDTVSVIELDCGESFVFRRANGERWRAELVDTQVDVLLTNLSVPRQPQADGGTLYAMRCTLRINGQPLELVRFVGSQESFYEPLVVDGVRLWFDGVQAAEQVLNFSHGPCLPRKHARFALQDVALRVGPEEVLPWFSSDRLTLDIGKSYAGSDCWMGAYKGAEAHGGLDLNQPKGSLVLAPIALDDHYLFHTLEDGANNNRWRGFRTWSNGDRWTLQVHHLLSLLVPERSPITAGAAYAVGSGVNPGTHEHLHYNFKVTPAGSETAVDLDPWILFWQAFEDERDRRGDARARLRPVGPVTAGTVVQLDSAGSRPGRRRGTHTCTWAVSDGSSYVGERVEHVFARPGVYAVTLTVDDGGTLVSTTQHVTVRGAALEEQPVLALRGDDLPAFWPRQPGQMDVYGAVPGRRPREVAFVGRPTRPRAEPQVIELVNRGGGTLPAGRATVAAETGRGAAWLSAEVSGAGNRQQLVLRADATGLPKGRHVARVSVETPGARNGRHVFPVSLLVPSHPPMHYALNLNAPGERGNLEEVRVDDAAVDGSFEATPWYWVGQRFAFWPLPRGYRGFSLTNGGRPSDTAVARFTPDLDQGRYEVAFHPETPFAAGARFQVRVHHREGDEVRWIEPGQSRRIGTFAFHEGRDGYVEVLARGASGPVTVDCVVFRYLDGRPERPPPSGRWQQELK